MTGQLLDNIAEQGNIAQAVVNHEDYETFGIAEAFEPSDPMVMASRVELCPMVSVAWAWGLVYLALTLTRTSCRLGCWTSLLRSSSRLGTTSFGRVTFSASSLSTDCARTRKPLASGHAPLTTARQPHR